MAHEHSVHDNDGYFILDPKTKTLENQSGKSSVIQYDHNSEEIRFKFPKIIEGHDMSKVDLIQVHYDNTSAGTSASLRTTNAAPLNIRETLIECEDDPESMTCSWLIGEESTQLAGTLKFKLKFVCFGSDNVAAYKMSTRQYTAYEVVESPDSTEGVIEIYPDIISEIDRLKRDVEELKQNGSITDEQIAEAVNNYLDENPIEVEGIDELQLYSYATRVQSAQTQNTLTLALMADTHYCNKDNNAQEKLDTAKTMGLLSHYADIDAIVNLGDMVNGNEIKNETVDDLTKLIEATKENAKCPVFFVRGNHDDNGLYSYEGVGTYQPDETINSTEWSELIHSGSYGYFDNGKSKIRVFLLNSSDIPYVLNADGSYRYNGYCCYAFSNEQLNFVANALQFADKENPNEWVALFLTHIPLDTTNDSGYRFGTPDALIRGHAQMLSIINAYRKGISYSFSGAVNNSSLGELAEDFTVSVNVDYSEKGVGDVICFVSGHTHTDNVSQKVGHEDSLSYGYTYLGIVGDTSFATMVVNREENIVSVFKYGEVVTPSDATHNSGAIDGETEFDIDMSVGTWIVPFEQFRPTNKNLYNGMSELWNDGYTVDPTATLDATTLELSNATVDTKFGISKGVPIKGDTQYEIPPDLGNSVIINCFTPNGAFNGTITATDGILTTKASGGYLVFAFHKPSYPDYENFYIREVVAETPDEDVEYVTKQEFENAIGDIDTALDELHAYAQGLISGGDEV